MVIERDPLLVYQRYEKNGCLWILPPLTCQLRFFFTESRTNNDITGNYVGTNWVEEDFLKKGLDVY